MKKFFANISFAISAGLVSLGFNKMYVYYNSEFSSMNKNAYVGGDAYNYIINGTYATAFFVLATLFVILGIGLLILQRLEEIEANTKTPNMIMQRVLTRAGGN